MTNHVPEHCSLPIARVLKCVRLAYEAAPVPLVHAFQIGVIEVETGEFWAYPGPDSTVKLGPFGSVEHAESALVNRALFMTDGGELNQEEW